MCHFPRTEKRRWPVATTDRRIRVAVLFGGPSAEHEVSCASALAVLRALRPRYDAVAIGVARDRSLRLLPELPTADLYARRGGGHPIEDRLEVAGTVVELRSASVPGSAVAVSPDDPRVPLAAFDVVFPLLHGPFGEDGEVQALLETLGVPYVGCGILASALGMDKVAMKRALIAEGIPVTAHVSFDEQQWRTSADRSGLVDGLDHPLFVKPANLGSSIGISRVCKGDDLPQAVEKAFRYDCTVVVEQGVSGREFECAVLGGFDPVASVVGEVTVTGGWFDYQQKYFASTDPMIVPARLPSAVAERVRQLSVAAFRAIGCWGLARVDFLYDEIADAVFVNELNTMPGFTAYSMYPKVWAAAGLGYDALVARLIDLAFERESRRRHRGTEISNDHSL